MLLVVLVLLLLLMVLLVIMRHLLIFLLLVLFAVGRCSYGLWRKHVKRTYVFFWHINSHSCTIPEKCHLHESKILCMRIRMSDLELPASRLRTMRQAIGTNCWIGALKRLGLLTLHRSSQDVCIGVLDGENLLEFTIFVVEQVETCSISHAVLSFVGSEERYRPHVLNSLQVENDPHIAQVCHAPKSIQVSVSLMASLAIHQIVHTPLRANAILRMALDLDTDDLSAISSCVKTCAFAPSWAVDAARAGVRLSTGLRRECGRAGCCRCCHLRGLCFCRSCCDRCGGDGGDNIHLPRCLLRNRRTIGS
mmetsp:Transcript_33757/g.61170  ORF Transcript_33757/g.61170 Transcript_33757/m.61170 type:complete len:307 (+) Transcript_33757:1093-2013(+)